MNYPKLYSESNNLQRHETEKQIKEFSKFIQWRPDGKDTLLDIGCGPGDVTIDYILPMMPSTFQQLIGVDLSENMINYANELYKQSRVCFKTVDIRDDFEVVWKILQQKFDHITSFLCLHWIKNTKKAIETIYNLLEDGGDCFLVFFASLATFDAYKELSLMSKWQSYMKDVEAFISPFHYCKDPDLQFKNILESTGFSHSTVELRSDVYAYNSLEEIRALMRSISPFSSRMPAEKYEEFLDDLLKVSAKLNKSKYNLERDDFELVTPYSLIVAYARK